MSPNLIRLSGLVAMLVGALGVVLTPILSYPWAYNSDLYGYFGRAYFAVYLGCTVDLAGLYTRRKRGTGPQGTGEFEQEKIVLSMTFVGLTVGQVGDILEYWGGGPGEEFSRLQVAGYSIEMVRLLLVLLGSVVLGLRNRRTNVLPGPVSWLLIAAGPGGILLSFLHIPSGTVLLFCCAWVILGYLLLKGKVASADQISRVS